MSLGDDHEISEFNPDAGLPVAVLAEPMDGDDVHEIGYNSEGDQAEGDQEEEGQREINQAQMELEQVTAEEIPAAAAAAVMGPRAVAQDMDLLEAQMRFEEEEADVLDVPVDAVDERNQVLHRRDQHPLLVRFANLRGRNAESISSYLFDMIREGRTCTSVLGGWARRLEGGCNHVVAHCSGHQDEAFYISSNGRTALHEACLRGSCSHIIRALLAANAIGATDRDHQGNTPLHLLFVDYSTQISSIHPLEEMDTIVGELLAVSPTFLASASNVEGSTALHMGCFAPETMVPTNSLRQLLEANPSAATKCNNYNQTPLRLHCQRRNASAEVANILHAANPDALFVLDSHDGWAPLHYAAANANRDLMQFLVDANPDAARIRTTKGETALHLLCRQSLAVEHLPCVDLLLQACPDAGTQRDIQHSYTPLHLLCLTGVRIPFEVVTRLLQANPKAAEIADAEHYLPLHHSCENGCEAAVVVALLEAYPSAAYSMTRKQDSALSLACTCNKSVETVQMLIQANPDALVKKNDYGFAPLHCICRAYQPRMGIVQALLDACPSCVTLKTHGGETPVHLACSNSGAFVGVLQLLTIAQNNFQRLAESSNEDIVRSKPMINKVGNTPCKSESPMRRKCYLNLVI